MMADRGNNFDVNSDYGNWPSRNHYTRKKPKRKKSSPSADPANFPDRRNGDRNKGLAKRGQKVNPNEGSFH